ncbi:MAG: hypothetical protein ACT4R6_01220 [Gemmatimonadaceae bacterium]
MFLTVVLLAQLAAPRQTLPVLAFPEPGLDDSAAYRGYQTRLFRDAASNTVQVYIDNREGRVVHVLADAENASIGFSTRDGRGRPAAVDWADGSAETWKVGRTRTLAYRLVARGRRVDLGHFLLGSMRVERDFQHWRHHRAALGAPAFTLPEVRRFLTALARLPAATQLDHARLLAAPNVHTLRRRIHPAINIAASDSAWVARVLQLSLDGRDTLTLEVAVDPGEVVALHTRVALSLRARAGDSIAFRVRFATTAAALTPLARQEIFTGDFLRFLAAASAAGADSGGAAAIRARRLERQVRGVELLASHEKLLAGLPTYATYFGRDMLVSALMMQPIWRSEMSEFVIASVLRKLSSTGQVSHEEALGGQAVREALAEYVQLADASRAASRRGDGKSALSLLSRAAAVLRDHRRVRENYHMIDDELQFPVLVARWLGDSSVTQQRKRAFLLDSSDAPGSGPRLIRLLRELALVAQMTEPYARDARPGNLIAFAARDSGRWASTSWRDSNAGYAGARYAMDVNAIWAPHALAAMAGILKTIRDLGFATDSLARAHGDLLGGTLLGRYTRDSLSLAAAVAAWREAWRHFLVRLAPSELGSRIAARLAAMPPVERRFWVQHLAATAAGRDSLEFLDVGLDAAADAIGVANSDPATGIFLGEPAGRPADTSAPAAILRDVRLFVRPYPAGLFIDSVGPVVANDAFAAAHVWRAFERDPYHGPRVAWGREVNLFLLGVANRIASVSTLPNDAARDAFVRELRAAAARVQSAAEASGFHSELWSYTFERGRPAPIRYGTGNDVQLWSTTTLAVQYALWRLTRQ